MSIPNTVIERRLRWRTQAFTTLVQTNLYNDELEKQKLTAAARAILSTINATSSIYDPSQIQTTTDIVSHLTFGVRIFRS
jgi:hypothetical protein